MMLPPPGTDDAAGVPATPPTGRNAVAETGTDPREVRQDSTRGPRTLELPQAIALVTGSIIGVGIFNLPYSLASYGPISIVAMALTTVGAVALAMLFAALSRRRPAEGGPYAYARAAVYLLSLVAVFGIVPAADLGESANKASYSVAANTMAGGGTWAGDLMAVAVIVSGFGALNGWTMICAEMPLAAARDGLFPARFGRLSGRRVPAAGIVASTVLASVAMVVSYLGTSGATVFNTLVLMTGIAAAIPYGFSALAQLRWSRRAGDVAVAVVSVAFAENRMHTIKAVMVATPGG
jgi:amino acid transporter